MSAVTASAKPQLPLVFGDNMVLQREQAVPIWGTVKPNASVQVLFGKQNRQAVADADGKFIIYLTSMDANAMGQTLMVISGGDTVLYKDVLVGEVWLASGQSNMEFTMNKSAHYYNARFGKGMDSVATHDEVDPLIRLFLVKRDLNKDREQNKGWQKAEHPWVGQFSAAAYYFAKELSARLKVPVGMMAASVSGSNIEPWLPSYAKANPDAVIPETVPAGKFFTTLIEPLAPYAMSGFLWYQGETNCFLNEREKYTNFMNTLIAGWRRSWNNGSLPFYFTQIAPFYYSKGDSKQKLNERSLAFFREAQDKAIFRNPNTARITTTDLVDKLDDIHPTYKWEIGKRLAWLALDQTYHLKQVSAGPKPGQIDYKDNIVRVNYQNPREGLVTKRGGDIIGFELAGEDGVFHPAIAHIKKKKYIELVSDAVAKPITVRFAWKEDSQPDLFNKAGLPAEPFRTDNFAEPMRNERKARDFSGEVNEKLKL